MRLAARGRPPARVLPADRVAAWRVAQQHLAGTIATSPETVATALVGVQAQVLSSAALSIAIRSRQSVEATAAALTERRLVRSWAMRGTLHVFASDDLPVIVAAIGRREHWHRPAWLRWFGVTEPEMEAAIEMVGTILDDGVPRTRRELHEELVGRLGPRFASVMRGSWGSFLNLATNRGYLCHATSDDGAVRFVRPRRWLATWHDVDGDVALRTLVERYLAAYGPASLREITRWWGLLNQRDLAPVLADLGDHVTEVEVAGHRGWLRTQDLAAIEATEPTRDAIHLLGPFDPLIVAAGLRSHLLPAAHLKRVSRTSGWISPVVLLDGVAAGVWQQARVAGSLTVTVDSFRRLSRAQRAALARAAAHVGSAHGATATVRYGPVFTPSRSQPAGASG
jgi:hypothetical protein